jgi:peptidoglycan hydrolase CwlO-like protein
MSLPLVQELDALREDTRCLRTSLQSTIDQKSKQISHLTGRIAELETDRAHLVSEHARACAQAVAEVRDMMPDI